jgi:DNA-binding MarR family transcriptional regulator
MSMTFLSLEFYLNGLYDGNVMRPARTTAKRALAEETWRNLWDFFISTRKERDPVIAKHQLTPNDGKALFTLSDRVGKTMGALAGEWICDASNATWMVDRLEKRGFAERRPSPGDRRVKMVVLTPLGAKVRAEIMAEFHKPPKEFLALDRDDLEAFARAARKLAAMVTDPAQSAVSG